MIFDIPGTDEEKKEFQRLRSQASQIIDEFEGSQRQATINMDLGTCSNCEHLEFAESRWGRCFAKCGYLDFMLNQSDPIERCNKHKPVGVMDLSDMWNIYTPIEVNKNKAGF